MKTIRDVINEFDEELIECMAEECGMGSDCGYPAWGRARGPLGNLPNLGGVWFPTIRSLTPETFERWLNQPFVTYGELLPEDLKARMRAGITQTIWQEVGSHLFLQQWPEIICSMSLRQKQESVELFLNSMVQIEHRPKTVRTLIPVSLVENLLKHPSNPVLRAMLQRKLPPRCVIPTDEAELPAFMDTIPKAGPAPEIPVTAFVAEEPLPEDTPVQRPAVIHYHEPGATRRFRFLIDNDIQGSVSFSRTDRVKMQIDIPEDEIMDEDGELDWELVESYIADNYTDGTIRDTVIYGESEYGDEDTEESTLDCDSIDEIEEA